MQPPETTAGPKVFVSFATPDKVHAQRFVDLLRQQDVQVFFFPEDVAPGQNFISWMSNSLEMSDYFVILLSNNWQNSQWVEEEWTSALAREVNERRAFLFIFRLDETPPPPLLASRNYMDAFSNWETASHRLIDYWKRDWAIRSRQIHVLPAPVLDYPRIDDNLIGVYIANKKLSVQHFMRILSPTTGLKLYARVRSSLNLPDEVPSVLGQIKLSFTYELLYRDIKIPNNLAIVAHRIEEGDELSLIVHEDYTGPDSTVSQIYRSSNSSDEADKTVSILRKKAFRHLMP